MVGTPYPSVSAARLVNRCRGRRGEREAAAAESRHRLYDQECYFLIFRRWLGVITLLRMTTVDASTQLLKHVEAPYADALRSLARIDWQRLHVPAHQGREGNAPGVAALLGAGVLSLDFPMSVASVDQQSWRIAEPGRPTPLGRAQGLAAEAWGARRAWFLTNGASGGNHIATTVARALGVEVVVQRSVHSSVVDGIAHVGLVPHFVQGAVDSGLGAAHGVTAAQIDQALREHPDAAAVFVVSPSYFGAVADIEDIQDRPRARCAAHRRRGVGCPFRAAPRAPGERRPSGRRPRDLEYAQGAGSLTQSAMLHLGHSDHAQRIEQLVDRVVRSYQSTSCSPLLLASLDETRRHLVVDGARAIGAALASAEAIRSGIRASARFRDATGDIAASPGTAGFDPFKIAIDLRGAGISGQQAQHRLITDHRIYTELATPATLLLLVGATSPTDPKRFLKALDDLPFLGTARENAVRLPSPGDRVMGVQEAFFADTAVVPFAEAAGRVSADSLAAYPPGIPNVLPGEVLTAEVIDYLRTMAAAPSGFVRGAYDPLLDRFRVVARP